MAKVRLGDIATVVTKGTTPTTIGFQFEDSGINFVKIESISEDGTFLKEKFSHISDECNVQMRRSQLQENDILFSIAGAIGRSAIVTKEILPANTNQALAIIRVPKGKIDYNYLLYALSSSAINQQATQHQQGVAQLNISLKNVSDFLLPIYTEAMQKRIVHNLKKIDKLISLRKQQLDKLDELVKARFVEMFGKASLLAQNQAKRLEECCISISGGNTPSMQHPEYYGGNIPFVKSGDVKGDYIVESTLTLTKTALTETTAKILPKSTLIVVIRSAALLKEFRIGMLMVDAVINQDLKALQVSEDFLPVYLMWAIKMQHQVLLNKVQTMLTSHIRMEDLLNLKIGTPPLSLQNQFAAFVERVDQQKQTVQQSLEKLELMKKALMQEYFG